MQKIEKIVIIGAGSVACNLAVAFYNKGFTILQVLSRTLGNAKMLAESVDASFSDKYSEIDLNADLYIIAVKDVAIPELISKLSLNHKLVVHTSGTVAMDILINSTDNYGVFYPLQTFSKSEIIDFTHIPLCIEANTPENEASLIQLAKEISGNVQVITSGQRKILHISAVFASNFSSYMYLIAEKILTDNQLSFDMLKPLILRTAEKVQKQLPADTITGPARRNDISVIEEHENFLAANPDLLEIYHVISENIQKQFYPTKK
ncbi:MAG: DUF2520 domain-containing protein [Bacteroidetes bacterium]|nr:DUF2520 domain-containing protein [Bacteroidota bacterium]